MPVRMPFDRVAERYDRTRALPPRIMARLLNVLLEELQGQRVLEIGVGTGRFAVPLQKSGVRVVGVDISPKMVELGRAKGLRDVLFADGARTPFRPKSFDAATTNHLLHLVPDWREVLAEIARVTRDTYFTIIERTESKLNIGREYHDIVREGGHDWKAPGLHERDLPGLLKPDLVMPVGPVHERMPTAVILSELERREYSSQWQVPEDLHRKAMSELRARWAGKEIPRDITIEVCFWRVERLAEVAAPHVSAS